MDSKLIVSSFSLFLLMFGNAFSQMMVQDVAKVKSLPTLELTGYGIVLGLDESGDGNKSFFAVQSVARTLKLLGIHIDDKQLRAKHVAAVRVCAEVPLFASPETKISAKLSPLGDAKNLVGGTLLTTPLLSAQGEVIAKTSGKVWLDTTRYKLHHQKQSRKVQSPFGRVAETTLNFDLLSKHASKARITLQLADSLELAATKIPALINEYLNNTLAETKGFSEILVRIPDDVTNATAVDLFLGNIMKIPLVNESDERVVIKKESGQILDGENIVMKPVRISDGNFNLEISDSVFVAGNERLLNFHEKPREQFGMRNAVMNTENKTPQDEPFTVRDVAEALNSLKLTPDEKVVFWQRIQKSGALAVDLILE